MVIAATTFKKCGVNIDITHGYELQASMFESYFTHTFRHDDPIQLYVKCAATKQYMFVMWENGLKFIKYDSNRYVS